MKQKRSTSPLLSEIAEVYASTGHSYIKALIDTRLNNLRALAKVTRHLAKGAKPVFATIPGEAVKVKIVDPGYLAKLNADVLTEQAALDFQEIRCDGLDPNSTAYQYKADGANGYLKMARGVFGKQARKVYADHFKLPDITSWKDVDKLDVYKPDY